eukprot:3700796-Prymnesium_polylepis.1
MTRWTWSRLSSPSQSTLSLAEDSSTNRMAGAVSLWAQISSHQSFKESRILLLLNKCDLLPSKLAKTGHMGAWRQEAIATGADPTQCSQ